MGIKFFTICLFLGLLLPFRMLAQQSHVLKNIVIEGNDKTRLAVIERELVIKTGTRYSGPQLDSLLLQSEQNLMNTRLFLSVDSKVEPLNSENVQVSILLKERWYLFVYPTLELADRSFNEWWVKHDHQLNRIDYGLVWHQRNVTGNNEDLYLLFRTGYARQLDVLYKLPFFNRRQTTGAELHFYADQNKEIAYGIDHFSHLQYVRGNDYLRQRLMLDFDFHVRQKIFTIHTFRFGFSRVKVSDSILSYNPDYLANSANQLAYPRFEYRLHINQTDFEPYPLKGFFMDAFAGKWGLPGNQMMDTYHFGAQISLYKPLTKQIFYSVGFQSEYLSGKNSFFLNRSALGYSLAYLRGYEYMLIPLDGFFSLKQEVRMEALSKNLIFKRFSSAEKFYKMPLQLYPKLFADFAYGLNKDAANPSALVNMPLYTLGIGIDVVSYYDVIIRIESGINHLGQSNIFLHFGKAF